MVDGKKEKKSLRKAYMALAWPRKIAFLMWVGLFIYVFTIGTANAQIDIAGGGDFSQNPCDFWVKGGSQQCELYTGGSTDNTETMNAYNGGTSLRVSGSLTSPLNVLSADSDIVTVQVPFAWRRPTGSGFLYIRMFQYDEADNEIQVNEVRGTTSADWVQETLSVTWNENAHGFRLFFSGANGNYAGIGPLTGTTVAGVLDGTLGGSGGDTNITVEVPLYGDANGDGDLTLDDLSGLEDITSELGSLFTDLANFDCMNPAADGGLGGLGGLIGGGGGGGLGALIKAVFNIVKTQLKLNEGSMIGNCELALSNKQTAAILQRLAEPDSIASPDIRDEIADIMATPSAGLAVDNMLTGQTNQGDDQVTAANRTNNLLVANMRLQARLSDRMLGGTERPAYSLEGGPLMTQQDVDADSDALFPENDYIGTRDTLRQTTIDQGMTGPDYEEIEAVNPEIEIQSGNLNCIANMSPPSEAEGDSAKALDILKWNAANALAASNFGDFLCSVTTQPVRSVQELCLGPSEGVTLNPLGREMELVEDNGLCVYGPRAPTFFNILLDALGGVMVAFSVLAVFKMYFA